ncbi:hypothetical protein ACFL3C_04110 [Patescibacteria group bacterium]
MVAVIGLFLFAGTAKADFPPAQGQAEDVVLYDFGLQMPESVTTDYYGNVYVGLFMSGMYGEIMVVDPDTGTSQVYEQFDLALQMCAPGQAAGVAGIWIHPFTRTMYANVNTCDPATKGVYKIPNDGSAPVLLSTAPVPALFNGIVKRGNMLYSTDSFSMTGAVYATPVDGFGAPAEVLVEHPLIAFDPTILPPPGIPFMPGANGIQKYHGDLYIGHSGKNIIIKVPLSGYCTGITVGEPVWHVDAHGVDDFAFDWRGNIYFTNDPFNELIKVTPNNVSTLLLDENDGINGSTAAAFGRLWDREVLFFTNAAFPFMPPPYNNGQPPSLMAYGNDIGGYWFR